MPDFHYSESDDQVFPELFQQREEQAVITQKPEVGERVRLTIDNSFSPNIYKHSTFRIIGTVVRMPYADTIDAFAVFVSDEEVPTRVIRLRKVRSINGVRVRWSPEPERPELKMRTFSIPSSRGDKTYTVENYGNSWTCTCAGFGFRHACKHVSQARAGLTAPQG